MVTKQLQAKRKNHSAHSLVFGGTIFSRTGCGEEAGVALRSKASDVEPHWAGLLIQWGECDHSALKVAQWVRIGLTGFVLFGKTILG